MNEQLNNFIIDTYTKGHGVLVSKLKRLKTTEEVSFNGAYHQDKNLCQIKITTSWIEDQLESWLYKTKGIDYIGVAQLKEEHT